MNVRPYIQKDNPDMPDGYKITVTYVNGKKEEIEVASHAVQDKTFIPTFEKEEKINVAGQLGHFVPAPVPFIEYVSKDDMWGWIPLSSIQRLEFDKNFTRILEINKEMATKKKEDDLKKKALEDKNGS